MKLESSHREAENGDKYTSDIINQAGKIYSTVIFAWGCRIWEATDILVWGARGCILRHSEQWESRGKSLKEMSYKRVKPPHFTYKVHAKHLLAAKLHVHWDDPTEPIMFHLEHESTRERVALKATTAKKSLNFELCQIGYIVKQQSKETCLLEQESRIYNL